jgi:hypothetical protein
MSARKIQVLLAVSAICLAIATMPEAVPSPESRRFVRSLGMDEWNPSPKDWEERGWLLRQLGYKQ